MTGRIDWIFRSFDLIGQPVRFDLDRLGFESVSRPENCKRDVLVWTFDRWEAE